MRRRTASPRPALRQTPVSSDERGLTLTELAIVGLMATVVMVGLTTFYFNSQQMWIDGSTQALAQRDATLLVDEMRTEIHGATQAVVDVSDPLHHKLTLDYASGPTVDFIWNSIDRRLHLWKGGTDKGPVIDTPVTRFIVTTLDSTAIELTQAELRTANGDSVSIASSFALLGR